LARAVLLMLLLRAGVRLARLAGRFLAALVDFPVRRRGRGRLLVHRGDVVLFSVLVHRCSPVPRVGSHWAATVSGATAVPGSRGRNGPGRAVRSAIPVSAAGC